MAKNLEYLHDLLELPSYNNTTIVWFTTTKSTGWFERQHDHLITAFNRVLYEFLAKKSATQNKKHFGFIDLYAMSKGVQQDWGTDHVHFQPHLYDTAIAYLMQSLSEGLQ